MTVRTALRTLLAAIALAVALLPARAAGTCKTNDQCAADEFCAKLFGACDESGKCETRPADCTERGHLRVKPVCGCDGKTYGNSCHANMAGTSVRSSGACAH